jgi:hypothetical protein
LFIELHQLIDVVLAGGNLHMVQFAFQQLLPIHGHFALLFLQSVFDLALGLGRQHKIQPVV